MSGRPSFLGPLLAPLLLGAVLGLALLLSVSRPLPTNDYAIYVAMGRQMLASGSLLERDPFTFTLHGEPFQHASWAWALLCAWSHELSGYQGLRAMVALSTLTSLGGVWWLARRAGAGPRAASAASLYAWVLLLGNLGPRSQTAIYPLFLLLAALLWRPPRPWVGALAGLSLGWIWTQLHGSFPIALLYAGAVVVGAGLAARGPRGALPAVPLTLGLLVGTMLGPYGPGIWEYVHSNGAVPRGRAILEWYAPSPLSFAGLRLYGALALWALLLLRWPRRASPQAWLLLGGFALMAATATRIVAWFGLATAIPLALQLTPIAARGAHPPALSAGQRGLLCLLGAGWLGLIAVGTPGEPELAKDTPVALVERLADEAPPGRIFAPMEVAGYLAQRFHEPGPEPLGYTPWPYFLDMRVWIFPDPIWDEFVSISAAEEGWELALERWRVSHLLLSHSYHGAGLLPAARASGSWELLAEDSTGALFRRVD